MIVKTITTILEKILRELGIQNPKVELLHPTELSHGDYSTNVALAYAKELGTNPRELAEKIVNEFSKNLPAEVEKLSIAGPGFINVTLSQDFYASAIPEILEKEDDFGKTNTLAGKKVLVEHSSPNLFKPFHIGHMMNNAIGESFVRLMRFSGADVRTMSFPSDISLGVAKAVFSILEKFGEDFIPDNVAVLGEAYTNGTQRYENDESTHARIKEIADNLYAGKESPELKVFNVCKKFNIEYFESVTGKLGSHFDSYIYESEAGIVGKEIVQKYTPAVFTESEGAIVYIPEESKKNLNTLVFINSQGNPTYEAKDIGLIKMKFDLYHPDAPDISIYVTDIEQISHFNVVFDSAAKINPLWAQRSVHVPHGRMSFKGQRMASRLGNVPLATDMIETVLVEVAEKTKDRAVDIREDAEAIAIGAIKFTILRTKPGQNINFDPETSLSFEGDSGPYLQYTFARIESLLEKGKGLGIVPVYKAAEISDLEKVLYRFPGIVEHAIGEYAPQYIVTYLLEIAQTFNSFYGSNQIIDEGNKEISQHRLALARATQIVIKNGLYLLGIKAPKKM